MRRSKRSHAAAGLCALMGLIAHAGASQLTTAAPSPARGAVQAAAAAGCAGSLCAATAWPYAAKVSAPEVSAPEVSATAAGGSSRPVRRVRVIALDAAPSSR